MSNSSAMRRAWMKPSVPSWFTPALATDWLLAAVVLILDRKVLDVGEPFQQPIEPFLGDPTLQYKHVADADQHVPGDTNTWLTLMLPLAIVLLISIVRRSLKEAHHAALALWAGYNFNGLVTNFVKLRVGRFRPDFFDRCKYDAVLKACTGNASVISEGRRSFPSGHSSSAFFGCVFLLLFLAGKNRCFAYSATFPTSGILQSRLLRLIIAIAPLFLSTYVAVSRWEDHWHHPTDIIAGSVLGTVMALVFYHIWWPSPFHTVNFDTMAHPRKTHVDLDEQEVRDEEDLLLGAEEV